MDSQSELPWPGINDLLLNCGGERNPWNLAAKTLEQINKLVPYDQARIYSLSVGGEVYDDVLFGVEERWPNAYYEYYSKILNGKYSVSQRLLKNGHCGFQKPKPGVYDWISSMNDEFVADYIRPQGIRHSLGFGLYDTNDLCKRVCIIDRTGQAGFSESEMRIVSMVAAHLDNLHRNFYFDDSSEGAVGRKAAGGPLTPREDEIVDLIRKGYAPKAIANNLFVSCTTVYKHITHIHAKLGVSTNQELLVKLFSNHTA